jgi:hypothetical protein
MELLTTVAAIIGLADTVLGIQEKFKKNNGKEDLEKFLLAISQCLHDVARSLEDRVYPNEKCAQLRYYYDRMLDLLSDQISSKDFARLYKLAQEANHVEKLFGDMQYISDEEKKLNIKKIQEAAGAFYAVSTFVKL